MIAALFVATGGCYFGLPDVDPWDVTRDARLYSGPHPVVYLLAHRSRPLGHAQVAGGAGRECTCEEEKVTTLQQVIILSSRCVAALDAGDHQAARDLMRRRDALYLELHPFDVPTFRAWANGDIDAAGVDRLLATEEAS